MNNLIDQLLVALVEKWMLTPTYYYDNDIYVTSIEQYCIKFMKTKPQRTAIQMKIPTYKLVHPAEYMIIFGIKMIETHPEYETMEVDYDLFREKFNQTLQILINS